MFKSIIDDIKYSFKTGNMVTRLIILNLAIFVVFALLQAFTPSGSTFFEKFRSFFALPGDPVKLLLRPWTLITHMFVHAGFFHVAWNMLFLYWFGRIVGDLLGDRRILPLYLLGGLIGAFAYILSYQLMPGNLIGQYAVGASAAVMAIVVTAGAVAPDYIMRLILIGDVKLKYIVLFILLMDIIGATGNINTGGHIAHLGGAFFGLMFVRQLREGTDFTEPVSQLLEKISSWFGGMSYDTNAKRKKSSLSVKYKTGKPTPATVIPL